MFPRIKTVRPLEGFRLYVEFDQGEPVIYDVSDDIQTIPDFRILETETGLFGNFRVDESRTCIYWSDRVDIPSDILLEYGVHTSEKPGNKR